MGDTRKVYYAYDAHFLCPDIELCPLTLAAVSSPTKSKILRPDQGMAFDLAGIYPQLEEKRQRKKTVLNWLGPRKGKEGLAMKPGVS